MSTGMQAESPEHFAPAGSKAWDQESVAQDFKPLTAHLESVAATSPIQLAAEHAADLMQLRPGDKALDAGCGAGSFFQAMANRLGASGKIVGVDHAPSFLEMAHDHHAKEKLPTPLRLIAADINAMPFDGGAFDSAHCERVLMHLCDPQRALTEMKRVVRPGGWIVAVEPDLLGWRIDLDDAEAARLLSKGFAASIRNPGMGLELNRRMAQVGLVDRHIRFVTEMETTVPQEDFIHFERASEHAANHGWLSASRAKAAVNALREQVRTGQFTSYSSMFICGGRVPASSDLSDQ